MEQTLGKRIVANRKRLGLTQDQLAEKLGVTAQAVSKWENDQSCPDISVLPQLAEIFGISTDALLGREQTNIVHEAEVIEEENENEGFHVQKGSWDFKFDSGKRDALFFAVLVLSVGILYLLSELLKWELGFWDILWPTSLLIFGLFGLYPKFSFFRAGCALFGGYFLMTKLIPVPFDLDSGIIFAVIVVLVGLSLLVDALRRPKKPKFQMTYTDKNGKTHHGVSKNDYSADGETFYYNASFGESRQLISLSRFSYGEISASFGEYTVDLTGIEEFAPNCRIDANCSFGELTLLVPRRCLVKPDSSTSFASFTVDGQPDEITSTSIDMDANVSFGEIRLHYV